MIVNRKLGSVSSEGKTNQFTCNRMTNRASDSTDAAEGKVWGITRLRNQWESSEYNLSPLDSCWQVKEVVSFTPVIFCVQLNSFFRGKKFIKIIVVTNTFGAYN